MFSFDEYLKSDSIGRYIEFKAAQDGVTIDEAARRSLGRLHQLASDDQSMFAILTGFRGERTLKANRSVNQRLESDLRERHWGFTPVKGGFVEDVRGPDGQPTGEKKRVEEESYFISGTGKDFKEQVVGLLHKYEQQAAVVKYEGDPSAYLLNHDGSQFPIGKWSQNRLAEFYTLMRKGPPNRQFNFECAGDVTLSTKMAVEAWFGNRK